MAQAEAEVVKSQFFSLTPLMLSWQAASHQRFLLGAMRDPGGWCRI